MGLIWVCGAALLATATAIGHSVLGEKFIMGPLRADEHYCRTTPRFARDVLRVVFHLPSMVWVVLGAGVVAARLDGGNPLMETVAAAIFALSGAANFVALRRLHFGSILLLGAAALTAADLLTAT